MPLSDGGLVPDSGGGEGGGGDLSSGSGGDGGGASFSSSSSFQAPSVPAPDVGIAGGFGEGEVSFQEGGGWEFSFGEIRPVSGSGIAGEFGDPGLVLSPGLGAGASVELSPVQPGSTCSSDDACCGGCSDSLGLNVHSLAESASVIDPQVMREPRGAVSITPAAAGGYELTRGASSASDAISFVVPGGDPGDLVNPLPEPPPAGGTGNGEELPPVTGGTTGLDDREGGGGGGGVFDEEGGEEPSTPDPAVTVSAPTCDCNFTLNDETIIVAACKLELAQDAFALALAAKCRKAENTCWQGCPDVNCAHLGKINSCVPNVAYDPTKMKVRHLQTPSFLIPRRIVNLNLEALRLVADERGWVQNIIIVATYSGGQMVVQLAKANAAGQLISLGSWVLDQWVELKFDEARMAAEKGPCEGGGWGVEISYTGDIDCWCTCVKAAIPSDYVGIWWDQGDHYSPEVRH